MTDMQKRVEKVANTSYPTKYYAEVLLIKDLGKAFQELTAREAKAVKALERYQSIIPALKEVDDLVAQEIARTYAEAEATLEELKKGE